MIPFSVLQNNNTVICDYLFEYDQSSNTCVCKIGYYINGTVCVHIFSELTQIEADMQLLDSKIQLQIFDSQCELTSILYILETEIQYNISSLSDLVFGSYIDLKQLIISQNETLYDNLNAFQTIVQQQFQLVSDQNLMTQTIIISIKSDISNDFQGIKTFMNINKQIIQNNFTQINSQITNLNAKMKMNFDQVTEDIQNANMNIENNFTLINQNIDTVNDKINAVATQIGLVQQQIYNLSVSLSQKTSDQNRCLMIAAWYGSYFAKDGQYSLDYIYYMNYYGCQLLKWW
ncbi:Hypothetical_protein [Hexamita inflata]|uniref:Hypothetical_protein n=1 Tax=Hexamita inflata TaxID=28002 RepID=A0AA86NM79_9EUKA|nr:Hypothetical protein HINF_LOCUS9111 [Hexamita inflata]